jgi:mannosyl-oligosaccharide alpha-1,2-mannosidase
MLFWALLTLASSTIAVPANHIKRTPTRSYPQDSLEKRVEVQAARASEVVYTFQIAWNGYYEFAFPNDELEPVTNSFQNPR